MASRESLNNEPPFTIGYFARICPEKGLHILAEAYRLLTSNAANPPASCSISGWLGAGPA